MVSSTLHSYSKCPEYHPNAQLFSPPLTAPSGEYVPAVVEHGDDLPCRGLFLLHQGIQRRIRITIVHEHSQDLVWRDVRELVVGEWIYKGISGIFVHKGFEYMLPFAS